MGEHSTTPRILGARHDRSWDMRPRSKVVETVWRPRATGRRTGGKNASTSVSSRRGIAGKNSRDPVRTLLIHTRKSLAQFDQVTPIQQRGISLHSRLHSLQVARRGAEARQNRPLQYLRALIAVNFHELRPRPDGRRCSSVGLGHAAPHRSAVALEVADRVRCTVSQSFTYCAALLRRRPAVHALVS